MNHWSPWDLWLAPAAEGGRFLTGGAGGLVFVVLFCALVDFVKLLVELLGRNEERRFTSDPSRVTAIIPSRNGAAKLPMTVGELTRFLPPERILVVDDGSTDDTSDVAYELGCEVHRFSRSKGKAAAINYAVHRVATPLTLLLDDDTRIGGARIPTSLLSEDGYDAVAFHVLPDRRNREGAHGNNFLGRLQRYEYGKSMEIGKRFHDVTESVSCISGAVGLFRTADLDRLHHQHTGVFQAEDLQRTIIHLLHKSRIVFANEPVWTVAPSTLGGWFRQRMTGWYPGLYHQLVNFLRLLFRRGISWRLRYEMMYNVYTVVSDPLKTLSMVMIAITPGLRWWGLVVYLTYLVFEIYPAWVVRIPGERGRTPLSVLLMYPIYGAINTLLRTLSLGTWFWFRYVTGSMRPRRGPEDRIGEGEEIMVATPIEGRDRPPRTAAAGRIGLLVLLLLALAVPRPAAAAVDGRVGAQYRYGFFSNHNDLRDVLAYWAGRQFHVQLEYWDFVDPESEDQFRPEVGVHLRDRRRSVYTAQWRHEGHQERFWLGTGQILTDHVVARAEVSPIVSSDSTLWVVSTGLDYYWKSWNFAAVTVIRDPRQSGLWIVPMHLRLANEANDWIQVTLAPASQQSLGWAVDVKKRWVRLGFERNNRYDFTNVDNYFITAGVEFDLARRP